MNQSSPTVSPALQARLPLSAAAPLSRSVARAPGGRRLTIGLACDDDRGAQTRASMVRAERRLQALGYDVDWVGDPMSALRRLMKGKRWDLVVCVSHTEEQTRGKWRLSAVCDLFDQPCRQASGPLSLEVDWENRTAPAMFPMERLVVE